MKNNQTEKLADAILTILLTLGIYFNKDSEKRLEQQIDAGIEELIREGE